jgi:hypothetical protein
MAVSSARCILCIRIATFTGRPDADLAGAVILREAIREK